MPDRMIIEFYTDPLGIFRATGLLMTFGELFPDAAPPPDIQADIAMVRDFAKIDRELGRVCSPGPSTSCRNLRSRDPVCQVATTIKGPREERGP